MIGPFIDLGNGADYHFLAPDERVLDIGSIAATLAKNCRFNGRLKWYSVAEHCVHCSKIVPPRFAFDALMHDAHEAVVQDIVTPLKTLLPEYAQIEAAAQYAMCRRYGNAFQLPDDVKLADAIMLRHEAESFGADTSHWNLPPNLPRVRLKLECWSPRKAEAAFLSRFRALSQPRWKA